MTPEDFGFDMSRWKAPNVATLVAANVLIKASGAPKEAPLMPMAMCHFVRELPGYPWLPRWRGIPHPLLDGLADRRQQAPVHSRPG